MRGAAFLFYPFRPKGSDIMRPIFMTPLPESNFDRDFARVVAYVDRKEAEEARHAKFLAFVRGTLRPETQEYMKEREKLSRRSN